MSNTPRGAPELVESQALPETTVNEQIRHTEAGACHFPVADRTTAPPGSCGDGATYLITATATGAWTGKENQLATALGTNAASGWLYHVPVEGMTAYAQDENAHYLFDGSNWGGYLTNPTESLLVACSDEVTALTAGAGKVTFRMPYAFTLTEVRASLTTAQATSGGGGILTVDINEGGTTVLSTKLTIDNTEKTSTTAATPPVISDASLADDAEITVDIDQIGDGTAKGLKIALIGRRT